MTPEQAAELAAAREFDRPHGYSPWQETRELYVRAFLAGVQWLQEQEKERQRTQVLNPPCEDCGASHLHFRGCPQLWKEKHDDEKNLTRD